MSEQKHTNTGEHKTGNYLPALAKAENARRAFHNNNTKENALTFVREALNYLSICEDTKKTYMVPELFILNQLLEINTGFDSSNNAKGLRKQYNEFINLFGQEHAEESLALTLLDNPYL